MELKQEAEKALKAQIEVLIVPSGIETSLSCVFQSASTVLIVPSGIETRLPGRTGRCTHQVLIVPSGIETILVV